MGRKLQKKIQDNCSHKAKFIKQCAESGCSAHSCKSALIIKGESISSCNEKAVDCIFIVPAGNAIGLSLVELKNNSYKVSEVVEKMECSEKKIVQILKDADVDVVWRDRVLVARGGHPRVQTSEYVLLNKSHIRVKRCGDCIDLE